MGLKKTIGILMEVVTISITLEFGCTVLWHREDLQSAIVSSDDVNNGPDADEIRSTEESLEEFSDGDQYCNEMSD